MTSVLAVIPGRPIEAFSTPEEVTGMIFLIKKLRQLLRNRRDRA